MGGDKDAGEQALGIQADAGVGQTRVLDLLVVVQQIQQGRYLRPYQAFAEQRLGFFHLGPGRIQFGIRQAVDALRQLHWLACARIEQPELLRVAEQ
ncbi:hypothetical protein D3C80_1715010 [compost metagenome]